MAGINRVEGSPSETKSIGQGQMRLRVPGEIHEMPGLKEAGRLHDSLHEGRGLGYRKLPSAMAPPRARSLDAVRGETWSSDSSSCFSGGHGPVIDAVPPSPYPGTCSIAV